MKKLPGTCLAGGGANGLELRRSLWLEAGSAWCQWPRGAWRSSCLHRIMLFLYTAFCKGFRRGKGFGSSFWLLLGSAMGPRCVC